MLAEKGAVIGDDPVPLPLFCTKDPTQTGLGLNPGFGGIVLHLFLTINTYRFSITRLRRCSFCEIEITQFIEQNPWESDSFSASS